MPAQLTRKVVSADELFRTTIQAGVAVPTMRTASFEDKLKHWFLTMGYDPFGKFGGKPHRGQIALHTCFDQPGVKAVFVRAGKRAGKSTAATAEGDYTLNLGGSTWVFSETLELCKAIFSPIWTRTVKAGALRVVHREEDRMLAEFLGGQFLKASSWGESLSSIEALSAHTLLVDEGQKLTRDAFNLIWARTIDTHGKLIVCGSEQEQGDYFDQMCELAGEEDFHRNPGRGYGIGVTPEFRYVQWRTQDNPKIDAEELRKARTILSVAEYEALYEGKKRPSLTRVFPEFERGLHVKPTPFIPNLSVELWVDPGYNFYCVTPVQVQVIPGFGPLVRVFDEIYLHGASDADAIDAVHEREWWTAVRGVVIDISARQHRAESKYSSIDNWENLFNMRPRSNYVEVVDGIERTRTFLIDPETKRPRIQYDPKCERFIDEYTKHKYPKGGQQGERTHKETPIDEWNHHLKSVAYGLYDKFGPVGFGPFSPPPLPGTPLDSTVTAIDEMRRFYGF